MTNMLSGTIFEEVAMTPEWAASLLETNDSNRRLKEGHVKALVWQIRNDAWVLNPQPVCINTEGKLIDGQHRLTAIVKAGMAAPITLARNVKNAAREVIDHGAVTRSTSDVLVMAGVKRANKCSGIVNGLAFIEANRFVRLPRPQLWSIYETNREAIDWAAQLCDNGGVLRLPVAHASAMAYAWPVDRVAVEEFAKYVTEGVGVPAGHPALRVSALVRAEKVTPYNRSSMMRRVLRAALGHIRSERLVQLKDSDEGFQHFYAARQKLGLSPVLKETP